MISDRLTKKEIKKAKEMLSRYGATKKFCDTYNVHRTTVKRMLSGMDALEENIQTVRHFIAN